MGFNSVFKGLNKVIDGKAYVYGREYIILPVLGLYI
jgi:hypothetical protein